MTTSLGDPTVNVNPQGGTPQGRARAGRRFGVGEVIEPTVAGLPTTNGTAAWSVRSGAGKARSPDPLQFRLLGHLEVVDQETSVAIGGIRSRATLGYLLLNHNSVVPVSRLIKALWPGRPPATSRKMLHNAISHLRGILGVNNMTGEAPVLLTHAPGYFLRVQPESVDMICFERQVEHAQGDLAAGRWEQAASGLRDALALWRGPALVDLVEAGVNWAELIGLENVKLAAVEDLVEAQLAMGQYAQVISKLETQLQVVPLRERMAGQLMRALYHGGRQSDALALYQRTRTALIEEFGLDPSPELQHLERAILNHGLAPGALVAPVADHPAELAILSEPVLSQPAPSASGPIVPAQAAPVALPAVAGNAVEIKQISVVLINAPEEPAETLDPAPFALAHEHITRALEVEAAQWGGMMAGMLGSLWMVVLGVPATGEFDAWCAIRAAQAISDRLAQQLPAERRAGANPAGTVVVTTGNALVRPKEGALPMITGPVIDRAMAQLAAARPGEVSICEQTATASRAMERRTRPLGNTRAASTPEPLVGREHELRILRHSWTQVRRLNRPHLVTVLGSAGMGKTRLLAEFASRALAADSSAECLIGSCAPAQPRRNGLDVLGDIVNSCCGVTATDDESRTRAKLASAVAGLPGLKRSDWLLGHLCDLVTGTTDGGEGAVAAWCSFLEATAAGRPTILLLEDVHRAADAVLDVIERLAGSTGQVPLLTIVTARPEPLLVRRPGWGGGKLYASTTVLQPLEDRDIRELAAVRLGGRGRGGAPTPVDAVVAKAGGNPLFAIELANTLASRTDRSAATVRQANDSTSLSPLLPPAMRSVLDAQIDALPPVAKAILLDAVFLGTRFCDVAVTAMGSVSAADAECGLRHLEHLDLLVRNGHMSPAGGPEYEFRISALREAAYERLVPMARDEKKRIAAEWLRGLPDPGEPAYQR